MGGSGGNMVESGHTFAPVEGLFKILDRILGCLLILGGIGQTLRSLRVYSSDQMTLLWSLSSSLFIVLLGALSVLRAGLPHDTALAWLCLVAGLRFIVSNLRFGVVFVIITLCLCAMCGRTLIMER